MNKLTAEKCREMLTHFKSLNIQGHLLEEGKQILQALEIALPVLEQQEVLSVPAYYIVYHPNPDPNEYDDKEHSHCGSIHLARRLATEIGGTICPVYFGEQQQPPTNTYRQIENDGWIEWGGGECPVESSVRVDLKLRGGVITNDFPATAADWRHYEYTTNVDIIAYRVIENDEDRGDDEAFWDADYD